MRPSSSLGTVYSLLAKRDLDASIRAYKAAKSMISNSQGAELLALHEAIVEVLTEFLSEIGEHHLQNQALWGISSSEVNIQIMVNEATESWQIAQRLRSEGLSSAELVGPYVKAMYFPIGSRDWLKKVKLTLRHQQDEAWIQRISEIVRNANDVE